MLYNLTETQVFNNEVMGQRNRAHPPQNRCFRQGREKQGSTSLLEQARQLVLCPQQSAQMALAAMVGEKMAGNWNAVGAACSHGIQKDHPVAVEGLGQAAGHDANSCGPLAKVTAVEWG